MSVVLVDGDGDVAGPTEPGGEIGCRHVVALDHHLTLTAILLRLKSHRHLGQRALAVVPLDRLRGRGTPVGVMPPLVLVRHTWRSPWFLATPVVTSFV